MGDDVCVCLGGGRIMGSGEMDKGLKGVVGGSVEILRVVRSSREHIHHSAHGIFENDC